MVNMQSEITLMSRFISISQLKKSVAITFEMWAVLLGLHRHATATRGWRKTCKKKKERERSAAAARRLSEATFC